MNSSYKASDSKKPTEKNRLNDNIFEKGKPEKVAVENVFSDVKDKSTKKEEYENGWNKGPKILEYSGGNGNDSQSTSETTVNQTKPSAINPNNRCGVNNKGCGGGGGCDDGDGDGDDPNKRNNTGLDKGHYRDFPVPIKDKGI